MAARKAHHVSRFFGILKKEQLSGAVARKSAKTTYDIPPFFCLKVGGSLPCPFFNCPFLFVGAVCRKWGVFVCVGGCLAAIDRHAAHRSSMLWHHRVSSVVLLLVAFCLENTPVLFGENPVLICGQASRLSTNKRVLMIAVIGPGVCCAMLCTLLTARAHRNTFDTRFIFRLLTVSLSPSPHSRPPPPDFFSKHVLSKTQTFVRTTCHETNNQRRRRGGADLRARGAGPPQLRHPGGGASRGRKAGEPDPRAAEEARGGERSSPRDGSGTRRAGPGRAGSCLG